MSLTDTSLVYLLFALFIFICQISTSHGLYIIHCFSSFVFSIRDDLLNSGRELVVILTPNLVKDVHLKQALVVTP